MKINIIDILANAGNLQYCIKEEKLEEKFCVVHEIELNSVKECYILCNCTPEEIAKNKVIYFPGINTVKEITNFINNIRRIIRSTKQKEPEVDIWVNVNPDDFSDIYLSEVLCTKLIINLKLLEKEGYVKYYTISTKYSLYKHIINEYPHVKDIVKYSYYRYGTFIASFTNDFGCFWSKNLDIKNIPDLKPWQKLLDIESEALILNPNVTRKIHQADIDIETLNQDNGDYSKQFRFVLSSELVYYYYVKNEAIRLTDEQLAMLLGYKNLSEPESWMYRLEYRKLISDSLPFNFYKSLLYSLTN